VQITQLVRAWLQLQNGCGVLKSVGCRSTEARRDIGICLDSVLLTIKNEILFWAQAQANSAASLLLFFVNAFTAALFRTFSTFAHLFS